MAEPNETIGRASMARRWIVPEKSKKARHDHSRLDAGDCPLANLHTCTFREDTASIEARPAFQEMPLVPNAPPLKKSHLPFDKGREKMINFTSETAVNETAVNETEVM